MVERRGDGSNVVFFCGSILVKKKMTKKEIKKKKTIISVTFFDGFVAQNGTIGLCFFGFAMKKVMTAMSLPSSMVVV